MFDKKNIYIIKLQPILFHKIISTISDLLYTLSFVNDTFRIDKYYLQLFSFMNISIR